MDTENRHRDRHTENVGKTNVREAKKIKQKCVFAFFAHPQTRAAVKAWCFWFRGWTWCFWFRV